MEDAQVVASLVRRCIGGDAVAWEELVQRFHRKVYNICYRFTGSADDAEDLTQEVFIKMYRTLNTYDVERGSFLTWMATLSRNLLVDHFRKTKGDRLTDSLDSASESEDDSLTLGEHLQDASLDPASRLLGRETQQLVQHALQKLSPELREAVILRDLQDMDYREIALALRVPEGTVKSRINRGRTELGRLLSRTYKQVS